MLARVLLDPQREYTLSELVSRTDSSMPTIQREVDRAERAGIVLTRRIGPARLVRANVEHPLHRSVRQLILGTYGPPAVIAREFADLPGVQAVLLFGSWAARYLGEQDRAPNGVDVLVIGSPDYDNVDDAADRAEREIGLPVQVTVRSCSQWLSGDDSFIAQVKNRPLVVVLVDDAAKELSHDLRSRESRTRLCPGKGAVPKLNTSLPTMNSSGYRPRSS